MMTYTAVKRQNTVAAYTLEVDSYCLLVLHDVYTGTQVVKVLSAWDWKRYLNPLTAGAAYFRVFIFY